MIAGVLVYIVGSCWKAHSKWIVHVMWMLYPCMVPPPPPPPPPPPRRVASKQPWPTATRGRWCSASPPAAVTWSECSQVLQYRQCMSPCVPSKLLGGGIESMAITEVFGGELFAVSLCNPETTGPQSSALARHRSPIRCVVRTACDHMSVLY